MSCSQSSPNSPYIQYLARGYILIGIDIILCWFTLFPLFIIPLSYPKLTDPNVALDQIMMIVSYEITMEMKNKNWLFYLRYYLPWWSSLWANFTKGNDTLFFKPQFFRWAPPLYVLLCVRPSVCPCVCPFRSKFFFSVPPFINVYNITLHYILNFRPPSYISI